ncbi:uncharacterized protein LOC133824477 [Humulus lupulus]|uniref:uncharacterized protein LOC133824477 n=1 Tax=Humulus lupulus TaxID=3486 RepID=UPI002B408D62|nr:uncharacterized protein LOC133824477 [Humulus lupulus]
MISLKSRVSTAQKMKILQEPQMVSFKYLPNPTLTKSQLPLRCCSRDFSHLKPPSPYSRKRNFSTRALATLVRPEITIAERIMTVFTTPGTLGGEGNGLGGNNGGDIGGGGGGDEDNGDDDEDDDSDDDEKDDDEYIDDDGGVNGGLFRKRVLVPEVFDGKTINAILSDWKKTMEHLPLGLQQACEMGILSSAKLTRFLWFNTRPSFTRLFARHLPLNLSLDFAGMIMADPALPYKLFYEAVFSFGWSVWLDIKEYRMVERKTFRREWHLVLTNAVTNAACNAFVVWSLAPRDGLINLPRLPRNVYNVFEKNQILGKFGLDKRVSSFFRKVVVFFALGSASKLSAQILRLAAQSSNQGKEKRISIRKFSHLGKEAFAAGLSMGLVSNIRHQLMCGVDRGLDFYFDVPKATVAFGLAMRFVNVAIGTKELSWIRSEDMDNFSSTHSLLSPAEDANGFDFQTAVSTGFGIVDNFTKTQSAPQTKKRVIRKKIEANLC